MALASPSNLWIASFGSLKGTLAKIPQVTSGDYWTSSIQDIVFANVTINHAGSTASTTGCGVSWTASSGTVYLFPATVSSTVLLTLYSGLAVGS